MFIDKLYVIIKMSDLKKIVLYIYILNNFNNYCFYSYSPVEF